MHADRFAEPRPASRASAPPLCLALALVLAGVLLLAPPTRAQDDLDDVFGGLGTAERVEEDADAPVERRAGEGTLRGQVFDQATALPLQGVTVVVMWPPSEDGSERRQEVVVTDVDGLYQVSSVAPGRYDLSFVKSGYRASAMTGVEVLPDQVNVADFPLPPAGNDLAGGVLDLDAFVVNAETAADMMDAIELRMEADAMLDIMSAEDFSKYAASDVAEALKRVVGVNVVEGQFAIIRGLEDRYSSTTYNRAPVPSPDPNRQSVQLDLFPSEIVHNLVVAKTFTPDLPGNSAGGALDIVTHGYPDSKLATSFKVKGGANQRVLEKGFLDFRDGNPVGKPHHGEGPFENEIGGSFGGRFERFDREIRYNMVGNFDRDFSQKNGYEEKREPRNRNADPPNGDLGDEELSLTGGRFDFEESGEDKQLTLFAALGFDLDEKGDHQLDGSFLWTKKKDKVVQVRTNGYLPGFDYELARQRALSGNSIDQEFFDGTSSNVPGINGAPSAWITDVGARDTPTTFATRGPLWFTNFSQSSSFKVDRDLKVWQVNGDHTFGEQVDWLEGLHAAWAFNHARTSQDEESLRLRYWLEPCGFNPSLAVFACPPGVSPVDIPSQFPVTLDALGPGTFVTNRQMLQSANEIDEKQWFGRFDADYEHGFTSWLAVKWSAGFWYEDAKRTVDANFVDPSITSIEPSCFASGICIGSNTEPLVVAGDPLTLGERVFDVAFIQDDDGLLRGANRTSNDSKREILALHHGVKGTFWDDLDLRGGVRAERIEIVSDTNAFVDTSVFGFGIDGFDLIFPTKFLVFDRFGDNIFRERVRNDPPFNDELLGYDADVGRCHQRTNPPGTDLQDLNTSPGNLGNRTCVDLVTRAELEDATRGKIDEWQVLPSAGLTYRVTPFTDWLRTTSVLDGLRGTAVSGLLSGQLTFRAAYSQTVARPSFREKSYYVSLEPGSDDQILGNPQLDLSEVESWDGRLEWVWDSGDVLAVSGFYKEIDDPVESIILNNPTAAAGGNFERFRIFFNNPNPAKLWGIEFEIRKSLDFFGVSFLDHFSLGGNYTYIDATVRRTDAELETAAVFFPQGDTLKKHRRLFGQPEWIANADFTFDQPEWGTRLTLAFFAISDILDASGVFGQERPARSYLPDLYVASHHSLDLVASQELWEGVELRFTAKNLTDSKRGLVYDPDHVKGNVKERSFRVGRDFTLQLTFEFDADPWF